MQKKIYLILNFKNLIFFKMQTWWGTSSAPSFNKNKNKKKNSLIALRVIKTHNPLEA